MNYIKAGTKAHFDKSKEAEILEKNMPLVHSCVRKIWHDGLEYDDLIQLGSIGLVKAIRRFDESLGNRFSTYAVHLIIGEIRRYLRDDGIIKVSRSLKEIKSKSAMVHDELIMSLGREPTLSEIARHMNIDTERLILATEAAMPCESLQREIFSGESSALTLGDTIRDRFSFSDHTEKIALKSALDTLKPRERKIIVLRYFCGRTQAEISKIIGVSQVQISRLEKKVISALREKLN